MLNYSLLVGSPSPKFPWTDILVGESFFRVSLGKCSYTTKIHPRARYEVGRFAVPPLRKRLQISIITVHSDSEIDSKKTLMTVPER
jgi:hypothetical protein